MTPITLLATALTLLPPPSYTPPHAPALPLLSAALFALTPTQDPLHQAPFDPASTQRPLHPAPSDLTSAQRPHHSAPSDLTSTPAPRYPAPFDPAPAQWPLHPRPEVVRGFELPPEPWLPGHRGLDLRGSPGERVYAAAPGVITHAGPLAGRGVVVISHGSTRTTYEPVVSALTRGQHVRVGEVIGSLSSAATHCPPATCLHWGLLEGDRYLDPRILLPRTPVRLLPL